MDIGTMIRGAREDRDMTQQEIANLIPMNQSNYSKIERNLQEPSLFQLKRIVEILHLNLYDLLEIDRTEMEREDSRRFLEGVTELYRTIYHDAPPRR